MNWADIDDDVPMPVTTGNGKLQWSSVVDDEPEFNRPNLVVSEPNAQGIRTQYEYQERNGQAVKITTTLKQKKATKKTNRFIEERRLWKGFGGCMDPAMFSEYGSNKPVRSDEEIKIEMNKEKAMKAIGHEEKFWENSIMICDEIINAAKKKKYDANEMRRKKEQEAADTQGPGRIVATGGVNSNLAGKYVPPSLRGGPVHQDDRNANTLRVMNLSEDTREGDVQKLFGSCGRVTRVFMPKYKEGDKEGCHKGFAFVQFADKKDAEKAIAKLNGHGYDSLILNVSWAQPKAA